MKEGEGLGIKDGFQVKLNYQGQLSDGRVFDSSLTRKKPFSFKIGEGKVIKGWEIGIKSMKVGEKAKFFISSRYGYKKKGIPPIIPPNADLFFEIESPTKLKKDQFLNLNTCAFQRRFRQELVNGKIDQECLIISQNLVKKFN